MKLTNKEIKGRYTNIVQAPYCTLHHLLGGSHKIGHTQGVYGWNADVYIIDNNTVVMTGYRPIGTIKPSRDLMTKYETQAETIYKDYNTPYEQRRELINNLLNDFIKEVLGGTKQ